MKLRSVTAGALATAMLATSAAPAAAQSYPGYGYGYGQPGYGSSYDRYRRRDNTGAVIAGVAAIGVIAAIAAASSNRRSSGRYNGYSNDDGYNGGIRSENQAIQACANAAQGRLGGRVGGIDQVYRTRDGFYVTGTVEGRGNGYGRGYGYGNGNGYGNGYGGNYGQSFSCEVRYGRVAGVNFGRSGY